MKWSDCVLGNCNWLKEIEKLYTIFVGIAHTALVACVSQDLTQLSVKCVNAWVFGLLETAVRSIRCVCILIKNTFSCTMKRYHHACLYIFNSRPQFNSRPSFVHSDRNWIERTDKKQQHTQTDTFSNILHTIIANAPRHISLHSWGGSLDGFADNSSSGFRALKVNIQSLFFLLKKRHREREYGLQSKIAIPTCNSQLLALRVFGAMQFFHNLWPVA